MDKNETIILGRDFNINYLTKDFVLNFPQKEEYCKDTQDFINAVYRTFENIIPLELGEELLNLTCKYIITKFKTDQSNKWPDVESIYFMLEFLLLFENELNIKEIISTKYFDEIKFKKISNNLNT